MLTLHSFLLYLHIVVGTVAMALFWIPVVTQKGGLNHRRFGQAYVWTMNIVAISAIIMSVMVLFAPAFFKADILANSERPQAMIEGIRFLWTLLLFLSVFTFVSVRNATRVLRSKRSRTNLRTLDYLWMPAVLAVISLVLLWQNVNSPTVQFVSPWLHLIFGVLGLVKSYQMFRFALAKSVKRNAWLYLHLSSMCGSGIAVYTAFFTFGARHILAYLGPWQLLFWIVPGVVGSVLIFLWSQKYDQGEFS